MFLYIFINFLYERKWLKYIYLSTFILILLSPILLINKTLYGSPFSFGYTQVSFDQNIGSVDYSIHRGILEGYIYRFGGQFKDPHFLNNLFINIKQHIFDLIPFIFIFGIISLLSLETRALLRQRPFLMGILICSIFILLYFGSGSGFNGFAKGRIGDSYTRYFLLPVMLLSVFTGILLDKFDKKINKNLVYLILIVYAFISLFHVYNNPLGIKETMQQKIIYRKINDDVQKLPENTVIISNFYSKSIINRPVFTPRFIFSTSTISSSTSNEITNLLKSGKQVYVIENKNHSTYLELDKYLFQEDIYSINYISEDFYKIELK